MSGPTREFWQERFDTRTTPWDRGATSPQLLSWLDAGALAPCRIAVPGCGSGYEVVELARRGFTVTALDYAAAAVARTQDALAAAAANAEVIEADVLAWQPAAPLDAVYEQTCLCALHPDFWQDYARALRGWLKPGGELWLLAMQAPRKGAAEGFVEGPPYHCDIHAVRALFPAAHWAWPKPPFTRVTHPMGIAELALKLTRL
jgi:methyl halide transferase